MKICIIITSLTYLSSAFNIVHSILCARCLKGFHPIQSCFAVLDAQVIFLTFFPITICFAMRLMFDRNNIFECV